MIDWTEILLAVISLIGLLITGVLVPYLNTRTKDYKASLTEKQRDTFDYWIGVAVTAFETYYKESGQGSIKKTQVKEFIRNFVASKSLNITEMQLDILIDATVQDLINNPLKEIEIFKGSGATSLIESQE